MMYHGIFEKAKKQAEQKLVEYYKQKGEKEVFKKAQEKIEKLLKPVEKYNIKSDSTKLTDVYVRLLLSCQNRYMMPNVIKFDNPDTEVRFKKILSNYDYKKISERNSEEIFRKLVDEFGVEESNKNGFWHSFARSVVDGAKFMKRFADVKEFRNMLETIIGHFPNGMALPHLISGEIYGMGEALACDFLKEIGCVEYAKPDDHIHFFIEQIINNFKNKEISYKKLTDKEVLEEAQKMARDNGVTAFAMDKILWLVASGKYYDPDGEEPMIKIKNHNNELRDEFVEKIKKTYYR
ncbi:MAG: hypothetical protein IJ532_00965 [Alphaproteobacteria bacterium]|nr:hypothetical protein [Alphaproteobacteria bacterium]